MRHKENLKFTRKNQERQFDIDEFFADSICIKYKKLFVPLLLMEISCKP
jgi:hypothetical protein